MQTTLILITTVPTLSVSLSLFLSTRELSKSGSQQRCVLQPSTLHIPLVLVELCNLSRKRLWCQLAEKFWTLLDGMTRGVWSVSREGCKMMVSAGSCCLHGMVGRMLPAKGWRGAASNEQPELGHLWAEPLGPGRANGTNRCPLYHPAKPHCIA